MSHLLVSVAELLPYRLVHLLLMCTCDVHGRQVWLFELAFVNGLTGGCTIIIVQCLWHLWALHGAFRAILVALVSRWFWCHCSSRYFGIVFHCSAFYISLQTSWLGCVVNFPYSWLQYWLSMGWAVELMSTARSSTVPWMGSNAGCGYASSKPLPTSTSIHSNCSRKGIFPLHSCLSWVYIMSSVIKLKCGIFWNIIVYVG